MCVLPHIGRRQRSLQCRLVKYTLILLDNSLLNGNVINTDNGINPIEATFDSNNGNIYVTNYGSNGVSVINGATNSVVSTITVGASPYGAFYDPNNNYVYITNALSGSVSIISTGMPPPKFFGMSSTELYLISGTVAAVIIIGSIFASIWGRK